MITFKTPFDDVCEHVIYDIDQHNFSDDIKKQFDEEINSDDFRECLAYGAICGELGKVTYENNVERFFTISLINECVRFKDMCVINNKIHARYEILDTPNGRIVKQKIEQEYVPVFDCRYWIMKKDTDSQRLKIRTFDVVDFIRNTK